jgi:malate dehydrogenase
MGSLLDTLRFRSYLAAELGVSREDIRGLVIGEHGDSMVPLANFAAVAGIPINQLLGKEQFDKVVQLTRTSGADVIKLKGSTCHAPGAVIAIMADAVLRGRNRVMGVSACLDGEYGLTGLAIGVPCVLGKKGVERILQINLDYQARLEFERSAAVIRESLKLVGDSA